MELSGVYQPCRVYALQLTESGAAGEKVYRDTIRKYESEIASQLSSEERTQLFELLAKVAPARS